METDGIYVKHEGGKVIANMTTERERERERAEPDWWRKSAVQLLIIHQ